MLIPFITLSIIVIVGTILIKYFSNKKTTTTIFSKEIAEYSNLKGDIYYTFKFGNYEFPIRFADRNDVEYIYNNIVETEKLNIEYIDDYKGVEAVKFNCKNGLTICVIPSKIYISTAEKMFPKCIVWAAEDSYGYYNGNLHVCIPTLVKCIDTIVKHNRLGEYHKRIIATTQVDKETSFLVEEAINNEDIKQLKQIINEYKETVNLSNLIADKLVSTAETK